MILAFFLNTAIDQQIEKKRNELGRELDLQQQAEIKNKLCRGSRHGSKRIS